MNRKVTVGLLVSLFILVMAFPALAALQWYKVHSGVTTDLLHCVFYDSNIGWAVGKNHTVLKTEDGGNSWRSITGPLGITSDFTSVSVTTPLQDDAWITDAAGDILHCTVSGSQLPYWDIQLSGAPGSSLNDICMTGSGAGFAVGNTVPGKIYLYGGMPAVWTQFLPPPSPCPYYGVSSPGGSPNAVVVVGANGSSGVAFWSNNIGSGNTWTQSTGTPGTILNKVSFTTNNNVYAAGDNGVSRSINGGISFNDFSNGIGGYGKFKDVCFYDSLHGWTVGENGIFYVDQSSQWNNVTPNKWGHEPLNGVFAKDSDHAWAVGNGGSIYVYSLIPPASLLPASTEVSVVNNQNSISLSWTAAAGATSYQVYRSKKSEGTIKLSDDFTGPTLDLTKWATTQESGSFDISINGGRLEVSGTSASTPSSKDTGIAGIIGRNLSVNTAKLIEISADVDLSHGTGYPVFGSPSLSIIGFDSGIAPFLVKSSTTQYAISCMVSYQKVSFNLDLNAQSAGNLQMLQAGNYASIFFNGTYKGKVPSYLSGVNGLNYMLMGLANGKSISMDIFFDNFKAVEYPLTLVPNGSVSTSTTSYVDTDIATGETYFYTVVPVNNDGYKSGSNVVEVTPVIPQGVDVTAVSQPGAVDLSWTTAPGIASYQIYRAKKSSGTTVVSDNFNDNSLNTSLWTQFTLLKPGATFHLTEANGKLTISGTSPDRDNAIGIISQIPANPQKLISISTDIDLTDNIVDMLAGPAVGDPTFQNSFFDAFIGRGNGVKFPSAYMVGLASSVLREPLGLSPSGVTGEVKALIYNYGSVFYNGVYKGKGPTALFSNLYYGLFGFIGSSDATTSVSFDNFNATEYPITLIASVGASTTTYHDSGVSPGESYFYTLIPVDTLGHTGGSNIVEVAVAAISGPPSSVTGVASIQGDEISLTVHTNTPVTIASSAAGGTPVSITIFGPNWSDKLDSSLAASVQQNQVGDISIKWKLTGKIAGLDKGIYPTMLRVGNITQKIYLVKY